MYTLFSDPHKAHGGHIPDANLINFRRRTIEDIDRVIQYYRHGTFFTRNDHLLVKLIHALGTPLSYDLDRYYEVTLARGLYGANALQLTSSISKGKWHGSVFYYGCPELIIASCDYETPSLLAENWRDLQPVKVLETPVSNLRYLVPTGHNQQTEKGLAVISVDIGKLMVMYRCFIENEYQYAASQEDRALQAAKHFVARYVLPNMLYSQTDMVVFNRMVNLQSGAPMGAAFKKHPFFISDYGLQLDKALESFLGVLEGSRREYANYIENVPSVFTEFPLGMPDIAETRQVWWALFLTRVKAMNFLIELGGKGGLDFNRQWINRLKVDLKEFNSDRIFDKMLEGDMLMDLKFLFTHWKTL